MEDNYDRKRGICAFDAVVALFILAFIVKGKDSGTVAMAVVIIVIIYGLIRSSFK